MANSVTRATSIRLANGGPLDSWEGPYNSIAAACDAIKNEVDGEGVNLRLGKKPMIRINGKLVQHWWPNGVYGDSDLKKFVEDPDLTSFAKSSEIQALAPKKDVFTESNGTPEILTGLTVVNGYYSNVTGAFSANTEYRTVLISVTDTDILFASAKVYTATTSLAIFFDKNMVKLGSWKDATATQTIYSGEKLPLPVGTAFVSVTSHDIKPPVIETMRLKVAKESDAKIMSKIKESVLDFERISLEREIGTVSPAGSLFPNNSYKRSTYLLTDDDANGLFYTGVMMESGAVLAAYFDSNDYLIGVEAPVSAFVFYSRKKLNIPRLAKKIVFSGKYSNSTWVGATYEFFIERGIASISKRIEANNYKPQSSLSFIKTVDTKPNLIANQNYARKWYRQWFQILAPKIVSAVSIPICRDYFGGAFLTGDIKVSIVTSQGHVQVHTIPFSEVDKYNKIVLASAKVSDFDYPIQLKSAISLNLDDIIQISWSCEVATDRMGLVFRYINTLPEPDSDFARGGIVFRADGTSGDGAIDTMVLKGATTSYVTGASLGIGLAEREKEPVPEFIFPRRVYTTCNNVVPALYEANRNNSAAIFLDHFFSGLTKELPLRFGNGTDKLLFTSPITTTNGANARQYNGGVNVLKRTTKSQIKGFGFGASSEFAVEHVSVLNSITKAKKPRVLIIADSIGSGAPQGVGATLPDDPRDGLYHLICKELFQKDHIDNGSIPGEYEVLFVGHNTNTRTFNYKAADITIKIGREGYPGMKTAQLFTDGHLSDAGGNFSIAHWLNKYRTMDDRGIRLAQDSPLKGTAVTSVTAYDVCLPTHIIFATGANDDITYDWLGKMKGLVASVKAEYAANSWGSVTIGIAPPDTAGTYFPSLHPNAPESMYMWNTADGNDPGRHERLHKFTKDWLGDTTFTEDLDKVFFVPMFFTMPPISAAHRHAPLPDGEIVKEPFGWQPKTHPDANAHAHWGYQLYSWLKYTLSL